MSAFNERRVLVACHVWAITDRWEHALFPYLFDETDTCFKLWDDEGVACKCNRAASSLLTASAKNRLFNKHCNKKTHYKHQNFSCVKLTIARYTDWLNLLRSYKKSLKGSKVTWKIWPLGFFRIRFLQNQVLTNFQRH